MPEYSDYIIHLPWGIRWWVFWRPQYITEYLFFWASITIIIRTCSLNTATGVSNTASGIPTSSDIRLALLYCLVSINVYP